MKYCTKCGNILADDVQLCMKCGCAVIDREAIRQERERLIEEDNRKLIFRVVCCCIGIAILFVIYLLC